MKEKETREVLFQDVTPDILEKALKFFSVDTSGLGSVMDFSKEEDHK